MFAGASGGARCSSTRRGAAARQAVAELSGVHFLSEIETIPAIEVRATGPATIVAIRALPVTDYVEPGVMDVRFFGTKGCDYPQWTGSADTTDLGDILPPHYARDAVQITNAWNRTQGSDVVVAVIDTGVSYYQNHLHASFATGQSAGRWHAHHSVLGGDGSHPAWHDQCGHGTRTTGVPTAPMNGGNMVGVAWKSDLLTVRFADGVVMPKTSKTVEAIAIASSFTPPEETEHHRRVVSMAWGHPSSYASVADEISGRYHQNGVLFLAASGTSGWYGSWTGVVFPARMDEVIAVSAVKLTYSGSSTVHYGPEVELTFFLHQVTTGFVTPDMNWLAGSSGGVSAVTGIAALVWSRYPDADRDWIRWRLQWAGHNYPNHSNTVGYGVPNAMKALGGLYWVAINGPSGPVPPSCQQLTAWKLGGNGPFTYQWSTGQTTESINWCQTQPGYYTVTVDVTDSYDGTVHQGFIAINVCDDTQDPNCTE